MKGFRSNYFNDAFHVSVRYVKKKLILHQIIVIYPPIRFMKKGLSIVLTAINEVLKANPNRATKMKTKRVPVLDSFSFSLERKFRPNRTTEMKTNCVPVLDSFSFSFRT